MSATIERTSFSAQGSTNHRDHLRRIMSEQA
jgi:hypothetical protein